MVNDQKIYPLPEAITDTLLDIREGKTPRVDVDKGAMVVPLSSDPFDFNARLLAMGRVRWTPKDYLEKAKNNGIRPDVVELVEDARVTMQLIKAKQNAIVNGHLEPDLVEMQMAIALKKEDASEVLKLLVKHSGTAVRSNLNKAVADYIHGKRKAVPDMVMEVAFNKVLPRVTGTAVSYGSSYNHTLDAAKYLQDFIDADPNSEAGKERQKAQEAADAMADLMSRAKAEGETEQDDKGNEKLKKTSKKSDPDAKNRSELLEAIIQQFDQRDTGEPIIWGPMETKTMVLDTPIQGYIANKKTASEYGTLMRNPHRWATDQRIFTRTKITRGGSVLIDCSGSMGNPGPMIVQIVKYAPGCTVALYEGDGIKGRLHIVANKGRMQDPKDIKRPMGTGENTVDKPALEWLARQDEPRFWVSDGQVIPVKGGYSTDSVRECRIVCLRANIQRINSYVEAVEYFKQKSTWE